MQTKKIGVRLADMKKHALSALFVVGSVFPSFSASSQITELDTWGEKILDLFTSSWVKAILMVALIIEAICVVVAGQSGGGGQVLKRFAPWIIGTIILLSASSICAYFLGDLSFEISFVLHRVMAQS